MYVCNCNGLSRRAVDDAIADGAHSPAAVFRKLDCAPQCGKCVCDLRALLSACRHKQHACSLKAPGADAEPLPFLAAAE